MQNAPEVEGRMFRERRCCISRGYALVTDERNDVVSSIEQLQPDQRIRAYFADGSATAKIDSIDPNTQLENL